MNPNPKQNKLSHFSAESIVSMWQWILWLTFSKSQNCCKLSLFASELYCSKWKHLKWRVCLIFYGLSKYKNYVANFTGNAVWTGKLCIEHLYFRSSNRNEACLVLKKNVAELCIFKDENINQQNQWKFSLEKCKPNPSVC